jgi:nucleotide-binding universal stress UspA family protein
MYKKILVPVNDSERARNAWSHARALADSLNAELITLFISKPSGETADAAQTGNGQTTPSAEALRGKLLKELSSGAPSLNLVVRQGKNIAAIITAAAEEFDCDLIILGSRRLPGARSVIARSVSNAVVSACLKPVLIV